MAGPTTVANRLKIKTVLIDSEAKHLLLWNDTTKDVSKILTSQIIPSYLPDMLIRSIPPLRSGSTFTYPVQQYEVLINNTTHQNELEFQTTINPATDNYKRYDAVYMNESGELLKLEGIEGLNNVLPPTLPPDTVLVSLYSIFGNIISDPSQSEGDPSKLDRGSFIGTADDLKILIDQVSNDLHTNYYTSTQIDSKLILKANDADVVHKTGLETIRGLKLFQNPTAADQAGISMSYSASGPNGLSLTTLNNSSGNTGVIFENRGTTNSSAFLVELGSSNANAEGISINTRPTVVPDTYPIRVFQGANHANTKFSVRDTGDTTANSFIKIGGTATQFLKADGSIDSNVYALDSDVLHKTGNESRSGILTIVNPAANDTRIDATNNSTAQAGVIKVVNNGGVLSSGMSVSTAGVGWGLYLTSTSSGSPLVINTSSLSTAKTITIIANGITEVMSVSKNGDIISNSISASTGAFTGFVTGITPTLANHFVTKAYADGLVVGLLDDRGSYNASSGLFPTSGGSGSGGTVLKGDIWYVSVAGTLGGKSVAIGDSFRALVDSPAQVVSNWGFLSSNIGYVPANDALVVHKTGNETISGLKSFINSDADLSAIAITTSNTTTAALTVSNIGTFRGGIYGTTSSTGGAIYGTTTGPGTAIVANNSQAGAFGLLFEGTNVSRVFSVDKNGNNTSNSFIKTGGTASQFLMADGSVNSTIFSDNSAGAIDGFAVTNNGNGTVNIATGTAYLRATNDPYAQLVKYTIPAVTNLALTDNTNNFILVDYNGGSPALTVTTNTSTINTETNSLAIVISRVGTTLDYLSLVGQNVDASAKLRVRFLNQEGIRRANGAVLGFSARNLTLTAGVLFSGLIRINSPAFNTASPDTFTQVYNNGSVWTRTTGQTQVNNTQYNNAGVLTNLGNNDYRTDYIYLLPNNPSKLYLVLGTTSYTSLTAARTSPIPATLPSELQSLGLLVGRSIIQRLATNITETSSAFDVVFADSSVPNHNDLLGIQGGAAGDYQHLTTAEKALVTGSVQGSGVSGQISYWTGTKLQAGSGKLLYNEPTNVLTLNANSGFFDIVRTNNGTTASPSFENVLRYGASGFYAYIQGGNSFTTNQGTFLKFITNSGTGTLNDALIINPSGNVGIGASSPNGRLEVASTGNNVSFTGLPSGSIVIGNNHPSNALPAIVGKSANSVGLQLNTMTADNLISGDMQFVTRELSNADFTTLTSSAFRFTRFSTSLVDILRNGNVGIGTSSPLNRLHLSGDTFNNSRLTIERTTVGTTGRYSMGIQNVANQFGISDDVQGLDRMVISPLGVIGFGITSPNFNMHLNSAANSTYFQITSLLTGTTNVDGLLIGMANNNDAQFINRENSSIQFHTNNTEKMRIHASGGVSIGNTTDPGAGVINVGQLKVNAMNTAPATATSAGVVGEIRITAGFIYICSATNTWVRAALSTF